MIYALSIVNSSFTGRAEALRWQLMRIWDVHPGYLARQQLLGEHRELHGLYNIIDQGKKGYARHPETLRWIGCEKALLQRHELLRLEMQLRGYNHHSPLPQADRATVVWPSTYIDTPSQQLLLLAGKYAADERRGRIPLPRNCQELWAQHKYSLMAHDPNLYRQLGPEVAHGAYRNDTEALSNLLVEALRNPPEPRHLFNALQHMWGYLKGETSPPQAPSALLEAIQVAAIKRDTTYLMHSTALSELAIWV